MRACLGLPGQPCDELVQSGSRCPSCEAIRIQARRQAQDANRPTASARGYGAPWRPIRAEHLAMEPDCVFCGALATEVDHIIAKRDGGTDDHVNLRSLCKPCHSRRTARDQLGWGAASR